MKSRILNIIKILAVVFAPTFSVSAQPASTQASESATSKKVATSDLKTKNNVEAESQGTTSGLSEELTDLA